MEKLYGEPGFGIWLANFRDIFLDEEANAEFSEFIADKIRSRVHDPVRRREADPQGPRLRCPAGPAGDQLLRGVQPGQRSSRGPAGDADRADHTPRHPHQRAGVRVRHHRLRHRLRCRHRRLRPHRHPRRRRAVTAGEVGRRAGDVPRPHRGGLPEHVHADRSAERFGLDELPTRHRARRRLGHRGAAVRVEAPPQPGRGHPRGGGGLERLRSDALRDHAAAQRPGLVHGIQLQRRRP